MREIKPKIKNKLIKSGKKFDKNNVDLNYTEDLSNKGISSYIARNSKNEVYQLLHQKLTEIKEITS